MIHLYLLIGMIKKGWKWCNVVITRQKDFLRFIKIVDSKHLVKKAKIDKIINTSNYNPSPEGY